MNDVCVIDAERFAYDTIDGETAIVDTASGRLFLLAGVAPVVFQCFEGGVTPASVMEVVTARYGSEAAASTRRFVDRLIAEGMLVTGSGPGHGTDAVSWPETFDEPAVEVYDDVADIITMDPIHAVDPLAGWPRPRVDGESPPS